MEEITIPTNDQVENLNVLKKYGKEAEPTDLYLLQSGWSISNKGEYFIRNKIPNTTIIVSRITIGGYVSDWDILDGSGVRPIISLSEIPDQFLKNKIINGIDEIEYGEYPQNVVDKSLEKNLENLYQKNKLNKTNKKYTFISKFQNKVYEEYIYKENKYIRVNHTLIYSNDHKFKNGRDVMDDDIYWVKVEPIKWLVDEKEDIAISKYILSNTKFSYKDNNYDTSIIKEYLEKYFIKEIIPRKNQKDKTIKNNIDMNKINDLIDIMNILNDKKEKIKQKVR